MADLAVGVSMDTSGIKKGAQEGSKYIKDLAKEATEAKTGVEAQAAAYAKSIAEAGNYKRALREAITEVQNLNQAYMQMDADAKNSTYGQAIAKQLEEARQKAANLKDQIGDMNDEIKHLASDTSFSDGIVQGMKVARDATAAFLAVSGMSAENQKKMETVIKDVTQSILVMNAMISMYTSLQKGSAFATALTSGKLKAQAVWSKVCAVATGELTVAELGAAVGAKALAIALNLIPFAAIVTAIGFAVTALLSWVGSTDDETDALKRQEEQLKKTREAQNAYYNNVGEKAADLRSRYEKLREEWTQLKNTAEKVEWIKKNASEFKALGLNVDGVTAAESIFVANTGKVVQALQLRARAMALQELSKDSWKKYYAEDEKLQRYNRKVWKKGDEVPRETLEKAGVRPDAMSWSGDKTVQRQEEIDALNKYEFDKAKKLNQDLRTENKQALEKELAYQKREMERAKKEQEKLGLGKLITPGTGEGSGPKETKKTSGGSSSKTKKDEALAGSIDDLQKKRQELEKSITSETYKKTGKTVEEVRKEIQQLDVQIADKSLELRIDIDPAKYSIEQLEAIYHKMYSRIRNESHDNPVEIEYDQKALKKINQALVDKKYQAYIDITPAEDALEVLYQKKDNLLQQLSVPDLDDETFKSLIKQYTDLNNQIDTKETELKIDTKPAEGSIQALQKQILDLVMQRHSFELTADTDQAKEEIAALTKDIDEFRAQALAATTNLGADTKTKAPSLKSMQTRLGNLEEGVRMSVDISDEDLVTVKESIEKLKKDIEAREIELGLKVDPKTKVREDVQKRVKQAKEDYQSGGNESSFDKAVAKNNPPVAQNDYKGQLDALEKQMNLADQYIDILEAQKEKLEEIGDVGSEAYRSITGEIANMKAMQDEAGESAQKIDRKAKKQDRISKNWSDASDAISDFGSAMSAVGKSFDMPELDVVGIIAQAVAQVALGFGQASAQASSLTPFGWIAFIAAGLGAMISAIAAIHSATGFATGGIIGGNSYSGDRKLIRVNSGEMVLNSDQQGRLWNILQGGAFQGASAGGGTIEWVLRGADLYGSLKNYNKMMGQIGKSIGVH